MNIAVQKTCRTPLAAVSVAASEKSFSVLRTLLSAWVCMASALLSAVPSPSTEATMRASAALRVLGSLVLEPPGTEHFEVQSTTNMRICMQRLADAACCVDNAV